ncbi:MAG: ATP-grasp domain-containing protein [Methanobrevibacter sp.]|uniref:ATP-grasp domain-containing protein n=1 Tax=Methanobrevibacter sp. TaxID=66852 RepID=UPI001B12186C|nr:ATP-grasp domain-containing protein [Methanobrevibacter sp.]MBO5151313.1 ATP-grasp domain-containing protein [Methanobrevibacter sp.]
MRNIVVVQCKSTGINYIQDIIDRNCNPVILEMNAFSDTEEAEMHLKEVRSGYNLINADYDLIYEKDTYEETLEMVKKLDPLVVVPGTEDGVRLATKLANDLNLLCNPIENLDAITLKNEMHKRLAENNLRSIRGRIVTSVEEAIEYYDSQHLDEVVIKPQYSFCSVGVRICSNKEEMIKSLHELFNSTNAYGTELDELLIQERIRGEEYVVNLMSCNGVHRVTTIWKYHKIKTHEGGHVYDYDETINELGIGEAELVEYAYDVADALGIKYGPVHGEYMIDEKGPVLIEVNCRPHGGNLDAKFLDRISGQHETDSSLDSYLNPDKFHQDRQKPYKLYAHGVLKSIIVPKDITAKSSPLQNIGKNLKSHHRTLIGQIEDSQFFLKTQDIETSPGDIYLVHEDKNQVMKDLEFLRSLEQRAFQLVLSEETHENANIDDLSYLNDIKSIVNNLKPYGTILLVTDTFFDDSSIVQTDAEGLDKIDGEFDCVLINLNKSIANESDEKIAALLLKTLKTVKVGGGIYIPKTTYDHIPNGRLGAEALVKFMNFKIELPVHKLPRMLIASKR